MKRPLAQCQIACRELLPHISRLVGIAVAYCHVGVEDGKLGHGCLLSTVHGGFTHPRPGPVRSDDNGPRHERSVGEGGDHSIAALVERDIDEGFTVLRVAVRSQPRIAWLVFSLKLDQKADLLMFSVLCYASGTNSPARQCPRRIERASGSAELAARLCKARR